MHHVLLPLFLALALAETVHAVKQGETLGEVARDFYGSPRYELVVAKHNKLKDKTVIAAGTSLKVGDLANVLVAEGIGAEMMDDVNALVKARYVYVKSAGDVQKALAAAGPQAQSKPAAVSSLTRDNLRASAAAIEAAAKSLAKKGKYGDSPTRMKNYLLEAAAAMRKLAQGSTDAALDDAVHRHFAQAWVRAIMWVRNEDGDG